MYFPFWRMLWPKRTKKTNEIYTVKWWEKDYVKHRNLKENFWCMTAWFSTRCDSLMLLFLHHITPVDNHQILHSSRPTSSNSNHSYTSQTFNENTHDQKDQHSQNLDPLSQTVFISLAEDIDTILWTVHVKKIKYKKRKMLSYTMCQFCLLFLSELGISTKNCD